MRKVFITVVSIILVLLLFFSAVVSSVNAKKILQKNENDKITKNVEQIETKQKLSDNKKDSKNSCFSVFQDLVKGSGVISKNTNTLTMVFFTALVLSYLLDIGILEIIFAGITGFLVGVSSWPILGPFFIVTSPIFGLEVAVETGSILAGVFSTFVSIVFGFTLPFSLSLVCFFAMLSLAFYPAPIWM